MRVVVQYFDGCPHWRTAVERVRAALAAAGADTDVRCEVVASDEEAVRIGFRGSPTILVDGRDPFADPEMPTGLGCRLYVTPGGIAGAPTVEQIRGALTVAA